MRSDAALSVLTEEQQADLFDWLATDTYEAVLKRIAQAPPKGFGIKTHINSLYRFYEQRQAQLRALDLHRLNSIKWEGEAQREGEAPDELTSQALDPTQNAPDEPPAHNSELATHNFSVGAQPSVSAPQPLQSTQSSVLSPQSCVVNVQPFYAAASAAFAHSTYILANSPLTPATYRAVSRTLHQHEDTLVKREYLDVARQQLALARERLQLDRTQFEYNAARAAIALLPELIAIDQMTDIDDEAKIWRVRDRLFGAPGSAPTAPASSPTMPNDQCSMIDAQCSRTTPAPSLPSVQLNPDFK